ncbi:hypothetical protein [Hyphococcus sp.]|uniref:hypothetical protein n=1 Tax=Hyphococcus sp. TaxID=2038636 RepID=UPI003CCB9B9C
MARKRTPQQIAFVTGRTITNPGRFKGRSNIVGPALGPPYENMPSVEKEVWHEFRENFPWLRRSDRQMTKIACNLVAGQRSPEGLPVAGLTILRRILNSFGGSPTSEVRRRFME